MYITWAPSISCHQCMFIGTSPLISQSVINCSPGGTQWNLILIWYSIMFIHCIFRWTCSSLPWTVSSTGNANMSQCTCVLTVLFVWLVECTCHLPGSVNSSNVCEPGINGHCTCKKNVEGPRCVTCKDTYYDLREDNDNGCTGNHIIHCIPVIILLFFIIIISFVHDAYKYCQLVCRLQM